MNFIDQQISNHYDFEKETSKNMTQKILCEVVLTLIFIACSVVSFVIW